jgi:hypothetical protein
MARKGCRSGTSGVVSRGLEGRSAGHVPRGTRLVRGPGVPRGTRPHPHPRLTTFHVEHGCTPIHGSRRSTWNTASSSSTAHDLLEHGRILIHGPRRSTWNRIRRARLDVPRGTRPHPHQRSTTFCVEHGCILMSGSRRSTWNTSRRSGLDVPRGTRPHAHQRLATFHVEHGPIHINRSRRSTWNSHADPKQARACCPCTRLVPEPVPAENTCASAAGGRSCRQAREEL